MKKFMNDVDVILSDSLAGFATAHAGLVVLGPENKFVRRARLTSNKVAVISGGGSGHDPFPVGLHLAHLHVPHDVITVDDDRAEHGRSDQGSQQFHGDPPVPRGARPNVIQAAGTDGLEICHTRRGGIECPVRRAECRVPGRVRPQPSRSGRPG